MFYLLMYGEAKEFTIQLKHANQDISISVTSIAGLPTFYNQSTFEENFKFKILDKKNALLTIQEFGWNNTNTYYRFMDSVFMVVTQQKINHLIIDIRGNGGGDDEFWMKGILKYIADKPYRWGSTYKKKIITRYRDAGEVIGTTKTGEILD